MKRWTRRMLLCLILGAITTVAVAWGCANWFERESWTFYTPYGSPTTTTFPNDAPQGWPVRALSQESHYRNQKLALALSPIWPGFLVDTLCYAAIWFGIFFGFTSAKRAIRRKRGRCPMCGYDLRGQREGVRGAPPATSGDPLSTQDAALSTQHSARSTSLPGCPECGWGRAGDDTVTG